MTTVYGDTSGDLIKNLRGGDQTITLPAYGDPGADNSPNGEIVAGDANALYDNARGGDDTLSGGAGIYSVSFYGDAIYFMYGGSTGGNDNITAGGGNSHATLTGDAQFMYDHARGGDDVLTGGANSIYVSLYGDATYSMTDHARGGNDMLAGGANCFVDTLVGDAQTLNDYAKGGDDILTAAANCYTNVLYGDAADLYGSAHGGNDRLIASSGYDALWGDGVLHDNAKGGADTFVLVPAGPDQPAGRPDTIFDFRQIDHDRIDVSAFGFHDISALQILNNGTDTTINFGGTDSVVLIGFHDPLTGGDFVFAK